MWKLIIEMIKTMINSMKKLRAIISRCLKIYVGYIISIVLVFILILLVNNFISAIDADFEMSEEINGESSSSSRIAYNYFLDFSPSMQGFFNENINSDIHTVAEIFEEISAKNENNRFFWCIDTIVPVSESSTFYQSMKTQTIILDYYQRIVNNSTFFIGTENNEEGEIENNQNGIIEIIDNIDLSKIFTENYANINDSNVDNLNVIITDMNFLRNESDLENHNRKMENLAKYLGEEAATSNISIYTIMSSYGGIANDESLFLENINQGMEVIFYLIIFSNNAKRYENYCQQFENALTRAGIVYDNKFELLNHLYDTKQGLKVDLSTYKSLAMITNENLNFANGLFKNLKPNEFAIQLVSEGTREGNLAMPISEISLPGYYFAETKGLDNTSIDIEVELYRPVYKLFSPMKNSYEKYEDTTMVFYRSAGMYYEDEKWYIRMAISLNTNPSVPQSESLNQKLIETINRRYIVMNLKFYMVEPSYLKPDWVDDVTYPYISDGSILKIGTVIDEIIKNKKSAYRTQSQANRYLGNVVVYILY